MACRRLTSFGLAGLLLSGCTCFAAPLTQGNSALDQVPHTSHVTQLIRRNIVSESQAALYMSRYPRLKAKTVGKRLANPIGTAKALPVYHPAEYLAAVTAGGTRYALQIDTGSSDTWFVKEGFQCLVTECNMGPGFKGDFPGGQIEEHFNISYGGDYGAFINGQMGYSDLTVADVTIPKQQIALATLGAWVGDGISSGILGLGLPGLTESFKGDTPVEDGLQNLVNYSPVVTTVTNQIGKYIFSLGLSRNESESFLALGGVPQEIRVGNYSRVPIEKMPKSFGGSDYLYYALTPDKMVWKNSTSKAEQTVLPQVIVDSGTTLNVFPYDIARSINEHFTPPAVYLKSQGGWFVPCNAAPPSLGVQIGGQMLWTDHANMILRQIVDDRTGFCATGIGASSMGDDGGLGLYILGDVFMQGLVAVFDVGPRMEMRFAKRFG
ncbi:aspartic peptidase domain-containing protein [Echria macrotheca]|uniref:Aspartic peptidase domain-containing protein n=1 Tax=Echria macrotheca TaxID=438768 RepID=A0AAJ0F9Z0_9PEZI|nr:aspartic peptidase domain-containing protein [Echria macrotheca]